MDINYITSDDGVHIALYPRFGATSCSIGIFVKAGAWNETPEQAGIAHCIEHMLFKSSQHRSVRKISDTLASLGAYTNAYTAWDSTVFYATTPAVNAMKVIDILTDMIRFPKFDEKEFDTERKTILSEIARRKDMYSSVAVETAHSQLFSPSKRFNGVIIGTEETVSKLTVDDLRKFHKEHYTASNVYIVVVGGMVEVFPLKNFINARWWHTDFEHGSTSKVSVRSVSHKDKIIFAPSEQIHFAQCIRYNAEFPSIATATLEVLLSIYGGGDHSRLFREIRGKRGLAYASDAYNSIVGSGILEVTTYVGTDDKNIDKVRDIVKRIQDKLSIEKVSSAELKRAKDVLLGAYQIQHDQFSSFMLLAGKWFMRNKCEFSINEYKKYIDAIDPAMVRVVANKLFCTSHKAAVITTNKHKRPK